jgi:hypothetical protein
MKKDSFLSQHVLRMLLTNMFTFHVSKHNKETFGHDGFYHMYCIEMSRGGHPLIFLLSSLIAYFFWSVR